MVTIPSPLSIGRDIPQSNRAIASYDGSAGAKSLIRAGEQVQQLGAGLESRDREQKARQNKIIAGQSMLTSLKADSDFLDYARSNPASYTKFNDEYAKNYTATREKILSGIPDGDHKTLISQALDEQSIKTQDKLSTLAGGFKKNHTEAYILQQADDIGKSAFSDPDSIPAKTMAFNAYVEGNVDDLGEDGVVAAKIKLANKIEEQSQNSSNLQWQLLPDAEKLRIVKDAKKPPINSESSSVLPKDFGADTVKPYSNERIASIKTLVEKPSEYDSLFEEMGKKYGVDPKELKMRAAVESGLNPTAQADATPYGQSGGLMQLESGTAKSLGVTDRNDPRQSVEGAAKLLAKYQTDTGNDQNKVDKLYYAGSEKNMGKNTEQYAANLAAVRGAESENYFGKTGTVFDGLSPERKVVAIKEARAIEGVAVKQEIENIQTSAKLGIMIPPERISQVADMALGAGQEDTYKKLTGYAQVQGEAIHFANKGLTEQQSMLKTERAKAQTGDLSGVQKLEAFGEVYQHKVKMLKEDAWGYYSQRGIVSIPEKSIFGNDPDTISQRRLEAEKVAQLEGGSVSLPLITDSEADQLKAMYDKGRLDDVSKALVAIGSQTNGVEKKAIANKVSQKDMILGAAMVVDATTSAKMLAGAKADGYVPKAKFAENVASKLSGVAINVGKQEGMIDAVHAYYKQRAVEFQDKSTEPNDKLVDEAIAKVVGNVQPISIQGNVSRVIVPNGMTVNELQDKISMISQEDLGAMGAVKDIKNNTIDVENLFRTNRVISNGDGIYSLLNVATGELVLNSFGKKLEIDVSKIKRRINSGASSEETKQMMQIVPGGF